MAAIQTQAPLRDPAPPPPPSWQDEVREILASIQRWPMPAKVFALGVLALYAPVIAESAKVWFTDDAQAQGVFIIPVTLFLLWMLRREIRAARPDPTRWGLALLIPGLLLETASYLLRIKTIPMLSLIPVLAGGILLLHGKALWKVVAFPIVFLVFAAQTPDVITKSLSLNIQHASTTGAAQLLTTLGCPTSQNGNELSTPNMNLDVADVCSGFKKLTALFAFSILWGYLFRLPLRKQLLLMLSTYPIALLTNVARICALAGIGSAWGQKAFEATHNWAEILVLIVAFFLFYSFGKALGCKTLRFTL